LALSDSSVESHDSELAAAGRQLAEELGTSQADEFSSAAERRAAERTARRRQRAEVSGAPASRGHHPPRATRSLSPAWTSTLRGSVPLPLIAVIAGGVLGVILGALSVAGWVIGLLVAGLTVALLRVLGSDSRSARTGAD
jgi:Na+/H+-translocating membrane pyrophosphatase